MNCTSENGSGGPTAGGAIRLVAEQALAAQLFAASGAASWGLEPATFIAVLERSAQKRFSGEFPDAAQLQNYLSCLHLQDLALACACAEGHSPAWDSFVSTYRAYLRSAAGAILRCPPDSPASCDLADSLFADLYGLGEGENRRSLFRYFHGRSSLKTWLRAVLAQRHIDAIRANRRFTDLDATDGVSSSTAHRIAAVGPLGVAGTDSLQDPHRPALIALFRRAMEVALGSIEARDKERLRLYYAAEHTLAEIGRTLGEHESSVSRNLERTRREVRLQVEQALRKASSGAGAPVSAGLSDEQITLCFQYAAEEAPIDLDKLLPEAPAPVRKPEGKKA